MKLASFCTPIALFLSLVFLGKCEGFTSRRIGGVRRSTGASRHPSPSDAIKKIAPRSQHDAKYRNQNTAIHTLGMIRGGAVGVLTAPTTAKLCSSFMLLNGIALVLAPKIWAKGIYKIDGIDEKSFESYILEAIGAISIGMGINVYLSVLRNIPAQRAMGFALLPRLLFVLRSFVFKTYASLGVDTKFLSTNTIIMSWSTFSLITGAGRPLVAAKLFSSMAVLKGLLLALRPSTGCTKFFGIDVSADGKQKTKALSKSLGNYLVTSAVLMASLAFGVDASKAAGYASLVLSAFLFDVAFISKTYLWMGETSPFAQIGLLFMSLLFAAGFLL